MNILYIHQYFKTPQEPGGTRSYWIAKELIKRGHKVTIITATNTSINEPGKFNIEGIEVIYVNNSYSNYFSKLKKIWVFIKFVSLSMKEALKLKDIDIVYATSTPLTVGLVALLLRHIKGWRYIFEVRDLWPEFPIQIGAIKNGLLIKLLKSLERRIYRRSEHIVALSPGMREGVIATGIPDDKCTIVPNMSKPDKFYPREVSKDIIKQFNINIDKFNVIHFGSMGVANGLDYIINAANELTKWGDKSIHFIFLGDGAMLPKLMQMVEEYGLSNVDFLGKHKMDIVSEIVNCCNISITTFKNLPILYTNSPNKLFDSLSAGKPIIVNSAGWTKELCEKEHCGFYVDPEKPEDLATKLLEIRDKSNLLKMWGENSRRLSLQIFDKNILSSKVADIIEKVYKNI